MVVEAMLVLNIKNPCFLIQETEVRTAEPDHFTPKSLLNIHATQLLSRLSIVLVIFDHFCINILKLFCVSSLFTFVEITILINTFLHIRALQRHVFRWNNTVQQEKGIAPVIFWVFLLFVNSHVEVERGLDQPMSTISSWFRTNFHCNLTQNR